MTGSVAVAVAEVVIVLKVEAVVVVAETELGPLEVVEEDVRVLLDDETSEEDVLVEETVDDELEDAADEELEETFDEELEDDADEELEDELVFVAELLEDDEEDVPWAALPTNMTSECPPSLHRVSIEEELPAEEGENTIGT
jgi:hypothetical protein